MVKIRRPVKPMRIGLRWGMTACASNGGQEYCGWNRLDEKRRSDDMDFLIKPCIAFAADHHRG